MELKRRLVSASGRKKLQLFNALAARPHALATADEIDRAFASRSGEGTYRITYVMNHVQIKGGAKILLEHANHLAERGHDVTIVCHEPKPDWIEVKARYLEVPWQMTNAQAVPESDVIVCSIYDQLAEFYAYKPAPVLLFEQGDSYIYDLEKYDAGMQAHYKQAWSLPVPVLAVSSGLAEQLHQNFDRRPQVLHNALDERFFYKREAKVATEKATRLLFVGAEQTIFKGIGDVRAALEIVRRSGREIEAVWVTPQAPESAFDGELYVSPAQSVLGEVYRSCDIYVSGSHFESFPLPPLEAMACGCAVVSTNNRGVLEYAQDGENCLLGEIGRPESLAAHLIDLIDHPEKRERLVEAGYQTAAKYAWPTIMEQLEGYLRGAMESWQPVMAAAEQVSLRVEVLPAGLTREAAQRYICEKNAAVSEGWCLWLAEGEILAADALAQMRRILAEPFADAYRLQVTYADDVPGHELVRWETRLVRGGQALDLAQTLGEPLPIRLVGGGGTTAFLPAWLVRVRELYRAGQFDQVVTLVHQQFAAVAEDERPVAIKWMVLGLVGQGRLAEAFPMMLESLQSWPMNSDLLYLCAHVGFGLNRKEDGQGLLHIVRMIGDALDLPESFVDVRELANRLG